MTKSNPTTTQPTLSPLRILILSPTTAPTNPSPTNPTPTSNPSLFPPLLHALTSTSPPADLPSFAGYTSHPPVKLRTRYYGADVGIWCDEIPWPDGSSSEKAGAEATLEMWREQMLSEAAREVRGAVGAVVLVLPFDGALLRRGGGEGVMERYLRVVEVVNEVREAVEEENGEREVAAVVLVQGLQRRGVEVAELEDMVGRLEDGWMDSRGVLGWEFVGWDGVVRLEELGEVVSGSAVVERKGIAKVFETLELVNWNAATIDVDVEGGFLDSDEDDDERPRAFKRQDGIKIQSQELEREMMGLKMAMRETEEEGSESVAHEEDVQVEQLQGLMERVVAIKEAGADMRPQEREMFARREVEKLMREMG